MAKKDPFAVLGLKREEIDKLSKADAKTTIADSYRKLALENHPDRHPGDKEAIERFKEATAAHEALIDPSKLMGGRGEWDTSWATGGRPDVREEPADDGHYTDPAEWNEFWEFVNGGTRHSRSGDEDDQWQNYERSASSDPARRKSIDAMERHHKIEHDTLEKLNAYYWRHNGAEELSDPSLVWALRRAQEILGKNYGQSRRKRENDGTSLSTDRKEPLPAKILPPYLFQFNRYDSDFVTNLGFSYITHDRNTFERKPNARIDTFTCDSVFVTHFLSRIGKEHNAWAHIFHSDQLGWITGHFPADKSIGYCIADFPSEKKGPVGKHFITIVTPDIAHTREALETMMKEGLIDKQHLMEMLEFGYNYRAISNMIPNGQIDEPFLRMLEGMVGVKRRPAIVEQHHRDNPSLPHFRGYLE